MELTNERRDELAALMLMSELGKMKPTDMNVRKLTDKLDGSLKNLPASAKQMFDPDWLDMKLWAEEIIRRHTGLGKPVVDEPVFRRVSYVLLLAHLWSKDLKLGVNLRRRIGSGRKGVTLDELHVFFVDLIKQLTSWLILKEES